MKRVITGCLIAIVCAGWATTADADLISTLNNTTDGITIDSDRSDWAGLTAYPDDSAGEPGIGAFDVDWDTITLANSSDLSTFYIRYQLNNAADFGSFPAFYNLFIDTDEDRGTGYIGGGSQLPIGAEYLLQGATLYAFTGGASQTAFSWGFVTALTSDNSFSSLDITFSMAASSIGNADTFDFVALGDNGLNGNTPDYYPDDGNTGSGGDYFKYTAVPEPVTAGLLFVGEALLSLRRRKPVA